MTAAMFRLYDVSLDGSLSGRNSHLERELAIAVDDLLEYNTFVPVGHEGGPYQLRLALADARLALDITTETGAPVVRHYLSLRSFRRLFKDYSRICESYDTALINANPQRLGAIDTGRRAIHDDASDLLRERLAPKVAVDKNTARRLFTLIYALFAERHRAAVPEVPQPGLSGLRIGAGVGIAIGNEASRAGQRR
ncbi:MULTISPECIES: UPF0262 family protein [unclassified Sinorhizobium]|uniref:UPF0262 family protein n=1 Tax=unclassified Sinorhizobium TaxID=2613772 RepID=UPI0024C2BF52|nr:MULTISPECIES: UPF0262 family protein [unclassified Sinorhizobium]MDK1378264.1 UPF0262 family protein [Sinorhizobium sp. 6-70]MDK1482455.1 UPF0262 family protein [Sinorhizobium sp. 6-117]